MVWPMNPLREVRAVCFDWGGTLMAEQGGPEDRSMAYWPEVHAIEGALEALAALDGLLPLAVATNASVSRRPDIELALARVGMARYVSHIFCFTELGCRKDSLAFWQAVESGLGVPMARIAMVGDSLEQDARAPRRLGVQRVWFKPDGAATEVSDVPMVDRLATFAQWVREAAAPNRP